MLYSVYIAAALSLFLVALSLNISRLRLIHKINFGDGGIRDLTVAIRAHGNSLEQSLFFILLLYFIEVNGYAGVRTVLALGGMFLFARLVYCAALFKRALPLRQAAHVMTMLIQIAAAGIILWH
ncbi:MAG TPA: MAPEG family protein [Noviherbaspirillum sp.]|nr:MAPEG family protein [Noviherbaspirillum sp.]